MAASKDNETKAERAEREAKEAKTADARQAMTGEVNQPPLGPEASGQKGAATLEEAMAQSDALARGQSAEAAEESGEAKAEADAEAEAAIAEAGAAQEARDDEVYGRTPAEPEVEQDGM